MLFINKLLITLMSFCYRAYSISFNSSKDCVKVHEKKKKVAVNCVFTLHKRALSCCSHALMAKKCAKKRAKLLFNLLLF